MKALVENIGKKAEYTYGLLKPNPIIEIKAIGGWKDEYYISTNGVIYPVYQLKIL